MNRIKLERLKTPSGKKFRETYKDLNVRIWSGQWGSWWRTGRNGYTHSKEDAGIYTLEDAFDASGHCGQEKQIEYEIAEKRLIIETVDFEFTDIENLYKMSACLESNREQIQSSFPIPELIENVNNAITNLRKIFSFKEDPLYGQESIIERIPYKEFNDIEKIEVRYQNKICNHCGEDELAYDDGKLRCLCCN